VNKAAKSKATKTNFGKIRADCSAKLRRGTGQISRFAAQLSSCVYVDLRGVDKHVNPRGESFNE
jgi:hypothetical protein